MYAFQFKLAEETVKKFDLDGLVVIGGDDSNTNACLLAEHFRYDMSLQVNVLLYLRLCTASFSIYASVIFEISQDSYAF